MVLIGKGKRLPARLEAIINVRKYITRLSRNPYRKRVKPAKKTPAEKKLIAERREAAREKISEALTAARDTIADEARRLQAEFGGHDQKYYEHQILQSARSANSQRKVNSWNAFLRAEMRKRNDALPDGAPRFSCASKEVMGEIRESWNKMSPQEKAAIAEKPLQELEDAREMKQLSVQNVPISAFHDGRATLQSIFEELRRLHARTGIEVGLVAVRTSKEHHTPPMTFGTSDRVHEFFQISLHTSMEDVASTMEVYCLSGVSGLLARSVDVIQDLQSRAASLIARKLAEATQQAAKKMFYTGFPERITSAFGVVIEGWPMGLFQPPSTFRTRIELTTLLQAWENKTAQFRKLTLVEWEQWQDQAKGLPLQPEAVIIQAVGFAPGVIRASAPSSAQVPNADDVIMATTADATPSIALNEGVVSSIVPEAMPPSDRTSAGTPEAAMNAQVSPPATQSPATAAGSAKPKKRRSDFGKKHQKRKEVSTQARTQDVPASSSASAAAAGSTATTISTTAAAAAATTSMIAAAASPAAVAAIPAPPVAAPAISPGHPLTATPAASLTITPTSMPSTSMQPYFAGTPGMQDFLFPTQPMHLMSMGGPFSMQDFNAFSGYPTPTDFLAGASLPPLPSQGMSFDLMGDILPENLTPINAGDPLLMDTNLTFVPSVNGQPPNLQKE